METQVLPDPQLNLDFRIDAFEEARRIDPEVDLANFLPPREHPRYLSSLAELIRVELDQGWSTGAAKPLGSYLKRFPELASDSRLMREIAFEEFRLRRQAGDRVSPEEYCKNFKIDAGSWPVAAAAVANSKTMALDQGDQQEALANLQILVDVDSSRRAKRKSSGTSSELENTDQFRELERERPLPVKRMKEALAAMPQVGANFLGFRLLSELGRGTFGRVFLAEQLELANRLVALKVATDIFEESQTLAQLQHTNIVPIYSFHRVGKLQAVCMPYFGSTTLGQVLEHIEGLNGRPISGKDLVTTLHGRRSMTRNEVGSGQSSQASQTGSVSGPAVEVPIAAPTSEVKRPSEAWKIMEGMSFTDAVLWLSTGIVNGLAHAHEHGVLHRDLKPANILLTDDGTPMLLDFNLAIHSEVRTTPAAARIGGTLPYMAPEQMRAFQGSKAAPDERSDIWSIGVIMFNLLTSRHPYPSYVGRIDEIVDYMIEDRSRLAQSLRKWNANVSPALEAIVRRCLEPSMAQRYQTARELHEDLERQLTHRPLKHTREPSYRERFAKWRRRHPRLTSSSAIAAGATALVLAAGGVALGARERVRTLHARTEFASHREELQSVQAILYQRSPTPAELDEGMKRGAAELNRYGAAAGLTSDSESKPDVRYLDETRRSRLREDIGELYFLMARAASQKAEQSSDPGERDLELCSAENWNKLAELSGDSMPRAIREQRADLLKLQGKHADERSLREELGAMPPKSSRDRCLLGQWLVKEGRYRDALPHLIQATQEDPENFAAWMVRGNAHLALDQPEFAVAAFSAGIALRPAYAPAWFNRGLAYSKLHFRDLAFEDFSRAVALDADHSEAYIQRAFARQSLGQWEESVEDLDRALDCTHCSTRAWFLRSFAREQNGDWLGAATDWARGLSEQPNDEPSFVARAEIRIDHPQAALADVEAALKINSISADALQLKAHILSERLHKPAESLAVLDRTVEVYPDSASARAGRGVVLARQGKRTEAIRDAEESLLRDTKAPNLYMVACIYALTSRQEATDRLQALELLSSALRRGYGLDIVDEDTDLDPIRNLPEFKRIVGAAKELAINRRAESVTAR